MEIKILISLFLYGLIIFIGEKISGHIKPFISRKIAHILCGLLTSILPLFLDKNVLIIILLILILFVIVTKYFNIFKGIELSEKKNLGTLYFPIGILLTIFFFYKANTEILIYSSLILAISDPLAGLIGKRYGKHNFSIFDNKSYEGSLIFFISCLIILNIFIIQTQFDIKKLIIAILGSLLITGVEASSYKGTDNILIPLTSASILSIISFI